MFNNDPYQRMSILIIVFIQIIALGVGFTGSEELAAQELTAEEKDLKIEELEENNNILKKKLSDWKRKYLEKRQELLLFKQVNTKLFNASQEAKVFISKLENRIADYQLEVTNLEFEKNQLRTRVFNLETLEKHYRMEKERVEDEKFSIKQSLIQKEEIREQLITSLRDEINSGKIIISDLTNNIIVRLDEDVLFDSGTDYIKASGFQTLDRIGKVLKQFNDKHIQVEGHTDNQPTIRKLKQKYPTNWELSSARATIVVRYLVDVTKLDPSRISSAGFGSNQPIADNSRESGREINRRVEFSLSPIRYSVRE